MLLLLCFIHPFCTATDTISDGQFITDGMTLVSSSGFFALGFFSPGKSNKRYVGIWYNKLPQQTVVWVANWKSPIEDRKGVLAIRDGNLAIFHGNEGANMWSTNVSSSKYSFAKLLDSGNLILYQKNYIHTPKIVWESFDCPSHVWLPGMKRGIDKITGLNRGLTSWKSPDDPAPGEFQQLIDLTGQPQFYIFHQFRPYCRGGPWSGEGLAGVPVIPKSPYFNFTFVNTENEISLVYTPYDTSVLHQFVLDESGVFQRLTWIVRTNQWHMFWSIPRDRCDIYNQCGLNGMCSSDSLLACKCLPGFEPKSPQDWILGDGSEGCVRKRTLECGKGEGFLRLEHVMIPDTSTAKVSLGLDLKECERECLTNFCKIRYHLLSMNIFSLCQCSGYMSPEYATKGIFSEKSDVYSFGVLLLETISGRKNSGYYYEYATKGIFSEKSDVYSFGVLLLETISGKKNSGYYYEDPSSNILGQAWDFRREGKALELIDPLMESSYPVDEILRCIKVGLLCVQGKASDRPTMATVVNMLGKEATMPQPKAPAYIMTHSSTSCTIDNVTVTIVQARE